MNSNARILVPTDFGPQADRALDHAIELARRLDGRIHLIHAHPTPVAMFPDSVAFTADLLGHVVRAAREAMAERAERCTKAGVPVEETIVEGDPRKVITDAATGCDLICIGTHGRKGLPRMLLGSTAETLVRTSPVPLLIVPLRDE